MSIWIFLGLIWVHLIADFVLQSDEMAINKSTSNKWLGRHALTYASTLFIAGTIIIMALPFCGATPLAVWHIMIRWGLFSFSNGIYHFLVDYVSSRIASRFWAGGKRHRFFTTIGVDQAAHLTILVLSCYTLFFT